MLQSFEKYYLTKATKRYDDHLIIKATQNLEL